MAQHTRPPWWLRRDLTPVGRLLADYARDHDFDTQQEFADSIGIQQQSLSEYLAPNGRIPRQRALRRIAEATGIPLITLYNAAGMSLYNGRGAPPPPQPAEPPAPPPPDTPTDMWAEFYQHLQRLHADGTITREVAEGLMNEAENIRRGHDPFRKHIIAEHVVESVKPRPLAEPSSPGPPAQYAHPLGEVGIPADDAE
jgi:transcriptional regulator with XRE-family HTH domain